jgi:DnaD/phage-associated family protein
MSYEGFPRQVQSVPVPAPMFGQLLEQIDDLDELKCTLRTIWLLNQKKGQPRFVTLKELLADKTLVASLSTHGSPDHNRVRQALRKAVERGTVIGGILQQEGEIEELYALNSEANREGLARIIGGEINIGHMPDAEPWAGAIERPNIFRMYEDNIGILSPMIADELREAEKLYPDAWIEDAFREAISQNKRNWRYISRILERWDREGRGDGRPGRYTKKAGRY